MQFVKWIEPTLGGVNLEDIAAPKCFEIERRLKRETSIPIFHDDQHGTAVVVLAALLNALKVVGKTAESARVVVSGAGAAGIATANLLIDVGFQEVLVCDSRGIIYASRPDGMNPFKEETARRGNRRSLKGTIEDALVGADILIGVSAPNTITTEMVKKMGRIPSSSPWPTRCPRSSLRMLSREAPE